MRNVVIQYRRRQIRTLLDNYYWHLWYRYNLIFFSSLIFSGRKLFAFNLFVKVKDGLKRKEQMDTYRAFLTAMMMVTPSVTLLPIKMGGRSIGVPLPIRERKRITMGVKFVIQTLHQRSFNLSADVLVNTLASAIHSQGIAVERKEQIHKVSSLNRHLLLKVFRRNRLLRNHKKKNLRRMVF